MTTATLSGAEYKKMSLPKLNPAYTYLPRHSAKRRNNEHRWLGWSIFLVLVAGYTYILGIAAYLVQHDRAGQILGIGVFLAALSAVVSVRTSFIQSGNRKAQVKK